MRLREHFRNLGNMDKDDLVCHGMIGFASLLFLANAAFTSLYINALINMTPEEQRTAMAGRLAQPSIEVPVTFFTNNSPPLPGLR